MFNKIVDFFAKLFNPQYDIETAELVRAEKAKGNTQIHEMCVESDTKGMEHATMVNELVEILSETRTLQAQKLEAEINLKVQTNIIAITNKALERKEMFKKLKVAALVEWLGKV